MSEWYYRRPTSTQRIQQRRWHKALFSGTANIETSTEDADVIDATARVHDAKRTPTEATGVTDDTIRVAPAIRTHIDAAGVTDVVAFVLQTTDLVGTANSPVGVTDEVTVVRAVEIVESVGSTDSVPKATVFIRSVIETVGVTDDVIAAETATVTIVEAVGVTDQTTRVHDAERIATEGLVVTDVTTQSDGVNFVDMDGVGHASAQGSGLLNMIHSYTVVINLDIEISTVWTDSDPVPIYAASGVSGGVANPSNDRIRRLPKSRLVRR